ncbi:hypothetical protein LTR53_009691 [Teratosphaeriaceae sp. CCFEE 6253]|nr:hypothetical protein LTR53_009691 [Teratosphaeriaceae sp. CCFEE 6253]
MSLHITLPQYDELGLSKRGGDDIDVNSQNESQVETQLASLSISLMDAVINCRDLRSPLITTYISPGLITQGMITGHICHSRAEMLLSTSALHNKNPGYHVDFHKGAMHCDHDKGRGWASVWLTAPVSGFLASERETRLEREWVTKLDWRWRGSLGEGNVGREGFGRWECIRMAGMTGCSGLIVCTLQAWREHAETKFARSIGSNLTADTSALMKRRYAGD